MMLIYDSPAEGSAAYETWKELSRVRNTTMLAVAAVPGTAWFEVRVDVVFTHVPAVIPVTLTMTVQVLPAATLPPDREIAEPPATADTVPPQVSLTPVVLATTSPAGSGSENARPVSPTLFEFSMVNVRLVLWLVNSVAEPNAFLMLGGAMGLPVT
jgi:hypothetical protein